VFQNISKEGLRKTFQKQPIQMSRCLRTAILFENIITRKKPVLNKKVIWNYGDRGSGKSILVNYLAKKYLKENAYDDNEDPNYFNKTGSDNNWFFDYNLQNPVTILNSLQILTEANYSWIIGITGCDPYYISALVIITCLFSISNIWFNLPANTRRTHQFIELGRTSGSCT
jgi:hypothetical protein